MNLTGLSIIWYALFDWEYSKERSEKDKDGLKYFMSNPELYKIGITNEKFTDCRFWSWILLGWAQALLIFFFCQYFP